MIRELQSLSLLDILPANLLEDKKVAAAAQALDAELQAVTRATVETMHLPRLEVLPEAVIDLLAWQWHVDFYEPIGMDIETKRKLVKESIAWHRIKGTPAAVAQLVSAVFGPSWTKEWFEYGGKPYHFRVVTENVTTDKAQLKLMYDAIYAAKNVRSVLDNIEFLLHLADDAEMTEGDKFKVYINPLLSDDYPWPGRVFDGSWSLGGCRYLDGLMQLDGSWYLDGSKGNACKLDSHIESLHLSQIRFPQIVDDFGHTAIKLDGGKVLNGEYVLGLNPLPIDNNGRIRIRKIHRLDGSWKLNGGDINYLDGSLYMDGRADLRGGGIRLNVSYIDDVLNGSKTCKRLEKVVPWSLLHPKLEDNAELAEDFSAWRRLRSEDASESTARNMALNEGVPLDGTMEFGENITPMDFAGTMEIRKAHRLNGGWSLDGGDLLYLSDFALDGTQMLSKRGNRFDIQRTYTRM